MKTWLKRFRASAALDRGNPAALNNETAELVKVHLLLAGSRPEVTTPHDLHQDIMRAVRLQAGTSEAAPRVTRQRRPWLLPRFALSTLAAGLAALLFLWWQPSSEPNISQPLDSDAAIATLNSALGATSEVPIRIHAFGPLEEELELLARDIRSAAQNVLSTVPL